MPEAGYARSTRIRTLTVLLVLCALTLATAGSASAQFGITDFHTALSSTQAGAHGDFSSSFTLASEALGNPAEPFRDASVTLPPGLIGDIAAVERCSIEALQHLDCGPGSQVGELDITSINCIGVSARLESAVVAGATSINIPNAKAFCFNGPITIGEGPTAESAYLIAIPNSNTLELSEPLVNEHAAGESVSLKAVPVHGSLPLFNVQPSTGHVATFATSTLVTDVFVQVNVGSDGRLTATIGETTTILPILGAGLTLWGIPAAPSHEAQRCQELNLKCNLKGSEPAVPFMTNPTSCGAPLETQLSVTSWKGESASSTSTLPAVTGCEKLAVSPSLSVVPTSTRRGSPVGYEADLSVPNDEDPYDLATPSLESVSVTLPSGVSLSPALAGGARSCDAAQLDDSSCPDSSRIGTAEVTSPALAEPLKGALYLGVPTAHERLPVYLRVSAGSVVVSLKGRVSVDEATGQVTTSFSGVPQLPLSALKLNLFNGTLVNPPTCGPASSSALVTSSAGQLSSVSTTLEIDEDNEGGGCPASIPFAPEFAAGMTNALAGRPSPFSLRISRSDAQQYLSSFTVHLPAGLTGFVGSVPLCGEPAATSGGCESGSEIGTATIASGAGLAQLYASGPVYLTGPYDGAPFGLDMVIAAGAGPFDLGNVLVRAGVRIDPATLAITLSSGTLPQTVDGVPLRVRNIAVDLNRPGFLANATTCHGQGLSATIDSSEGASAEVSSPYRLAECARLAFAPRLKAAMPAKAALQGNGAGLELHVVNDAGGGRLRSIAVRLPSQLRPRLTTIQKACLTSTQISSLERCSTDSIIGRTTVESPLTKAPLTGPIYLVSRGKGALPSLAVLLRGGGVEAELQGMFEISSTNVITTVFSDLPDVPVSEFTLELPRGPHSILGAVASLCASSMSLSYRLTDQAGALVEHATRAAVNGCARRVTARERSRRSKGAGRASTRERRGSHSHQRASTLHS